MDIPETKYATLGRDRIAYQVVGEGPLDLLCVPAFGESIDLRWDWPPSRDFLFRLASFARLVMFDRRGAGASDPISYEGLPPWEQWADDARAVLDAVGSERAALLGVNDTGPTAILFAATEPERTRALVLFTTTPRFKAADGYPGGQTEETLEELRSFLVDIWGTEGIVDFGTPEMVDSQPYRRWQAKMNRLALSPVNAAQYLHVLQRMDVREVLPAVRVPTLVMHRETAAEFPFPIEQGRYIADHIPEARFLAVPGGNYPIWAEPNEGILNSIEEFLTGVRPIRSPDRVLAAVLFTDIVDSTHRAATLGDRRWKELLQTHDLVARTFIEEHQGNLVKSTGDGILATFDGPGRAIRCALAFQEALRPLGLEIRMGLHTGEVELRGADIGGIGVHVAARVLEHAGAGELLTSGAVPMLVAGSGIEFDDRGEHSLKGVPGDWRLYAVRA